MKELKMSEEIMNDFQGAYSFIEDHPAFGWREMNIDMNIRNCCRNSYDLNMSPKDIYISKNNPRYTSFLEESKNNKEIHLEHLDDDGFLKLETEFQLPNLRVPYKMYFGYEWEEDHVEIWLESGAMRYFEQSGRWERWHDDNLDSGGRTYEDAIINLASKVKNFYGDFNKDFGDNVLVPDWVTEWNEKNPLKFADLFKNGQLNSGRYISINGIEFNELWWHKYGNKKTSMSANFKTTDISFLLDYKEFKKKYV
jgi:hypothetical protein